MWYLRCLLASCFVLFQISVLAEPAPLKFYSEHSPPFFIDQGNGTFQGASVDLAQALMKQTGLTGTIAHVPWARAMQEVKNQSNVVLMTVLRNDEREEQLQWLGNVYQTEAHLIGLKGKAQAAISSLEQAKTLRVGTIRGYAAAQYLLAQGFTEDKNLVLLSDTHQLYSMLFKGRLDLVLHDVRVGRFDVTEQGYDASKLQSILTIEALCRELQMATGQTTSTERVEQLRQAMQSLKANGTFDDIMRKWSLH